MARKIVQPPFIELRNITQIRNGSIVEVRCRHQTQPSSEDGFNYELGYVHDVRRRDENLVLYREIDGNPEGPNPLRVDLLSHFRILARPEDQINSGCPTYDRAEFSGKVETGSVVELEGIVEGRSIKRVGYVYEIGDEELLLSTRHPSNKENPPAAIDVKGIRHDCLGRYRILAKHSFREFAPAE